MGGTTNEDGGDLVENVDGLLGRGALVGYSFLALGRHSKGSLGHGASRECDELLSLAVGAWFWWE